MTGEFSNLQLLKLGGSLITEKTSAHTLRAGVLARLVGEIAAALRDNPGLRLVLGHGSGSFGHVPARQHGTRLGVHDAEGWWGFAEVWREAAALNHLVLDALAAAGLHAIAFPPSAAITARDGSVASWDLQPLQQALRAGLLPVVYGDVVFDILRGGTILSTEDLFEYLAPRLGPQRVLLAGLEPGVWADFPARSRLVEKLTPTDMGGLAEAAGASHGVDVTGGMASKVQQSLRLVQSVPGLEVCIFSGELPGELQRALSGKASGTCIRAA